MGYEFDPDKSRRNKQDPSRRFDFDVSETFDWKTALTYLDTRRDYGEDRYVSYGFIRGRLHVMVWTPRKPNIRVISLRKANLRERKFYEKETGRNLYIQ